VPGCGDSGPLFQPLPVADGTACDDSDPTTIADTCVSGTCVPGPEPDCDDGDPCTMDALDPAEGCFHLLIEGPGCLEDHRYDPICTGSGPGFPDYQCFPPMW
jgi:hypothetical protein